MISKQVSIHRSYLFSQLLYKQTSWRKCNHKPCQSCQPLSWKTSGYQVLILILLRAIETLAKNAISQTSEHYFLDTEQIQKRKNLTSFITEATRLTDRHLQIEPLAPGHPILLVLSGAALRVADVVRWVIPLLKTFTVLIFAPSRDLRGICGNGEVAKLFAKHFKLAEHVSSILDLLAPFDTKADVRYSVPTARRPSSA
jgi:hypothetical protein